jgi:hypothetical protein
LARISLVNASAVGRVRPAAHLVIISSSELFEDMVNAKQFKEKCRLNVIDGKDRIRG